MAVIVPAVLATDISQYRRYIEVYNNFAKRIQVDITDGEFAQNQTIDESNIWWNQEKTVCDVHMMVTNPSQHIQTILKINPSLCIFHCEASEDLLPIFDQLKNAGIKTGVAFLKQTYPGSPKAKKYLEAADHALIFSGKLGMQGGEADLLQTEKVDIIRAIKPNIEIGWDGGANMSNVRALAHSGIDVINVGSAISHAQNAPEIFNQLTEELDKNGVVI